jgi:hypothetical protein
VWIYAVLLNRHSKCLTQILLCFVVPNGEHLSRPNEVEKKRNYKLIIDPMLKGRGHQKIYRFEGDFDGVSRVLVTMDSHKLPLVSVLKFYAVLF